MPEPRPPLSEKALTVAGKKLPSQLDLVREQHRRGRPGLTLAQFVVAGWSTIEPFAPLVWGWHLDFLCQHVQALLENSFAEQPDPKIPQNLLINIPPGTMKSLVVSVFAPAWVWLFRPTWRVGCASAADGVASRDSLRCRNLIESEWYRETFQPEWELSTDQNEKMHFSNTRGGFRLATTTARKITGQRFDAELIDDPHDAQEVTSKAERERVLNWYDQAFHNRVASPARAVRICIMQRLHEEDLSNHLLGLGWAHICLPMEFEPEHTRETFLGVRDPRSEPGELLFPARFPPSVLEEDRRTLGSTGYAGQHQQRPVPLGGNRFQRHWWRFWSLDGEPRQRPSGCMVEPPVKYSPAQRQPLRVLTLDCTFKSGHDKDFVAAMVVDVHGAKRFVVAHRREQTGLTGTLRLVTDLIQTWKPSKIIVEEKANGAAVIEVLSKQFTGVIPVQPKGDKESRAAVLEPVVESGSWYLQESAPWLEELVTEFASFPLGAHDDQVDALSQLEVYLTESPDIRRVWSLLTM